MKRLILLLVLLPALVAAQEPVLEPIVQAGDLIAWDFRDVDLTSQNITRFEVCFDRSPICVVALPADAVLVRTPPAPAGTISYITALPTTWVAGSVHTVTVKACSASACGPAVFPLAFRWVVPPTAVPFNLRVVPGG